MQNYPFKLIAKALGLLLISAVFLFIKTGEVKAAVGLSVGHTGLNLLQTENLYYGNIGAGSHASSTFLLFQNNSADRLRIDISGNLTTTGSITANAFTGPITGGSISAANVSAGLFGSNVGNGNFSFPGNVGIGVTNPEAKLDVDGDVSYLAQSALYPRRKSVASDWYLGQFDGVNKINNALGASGDNAFQIGYFSGGVFAPNIKLSAGGGNASYFNAGNVGIGTTNPQAKLHVAGDGYSLYGPNSTWNANLRVGGNGNVGTDASIAATNGNLHLDPKTGAFATYINYYRGTDGVNFGNGASATVARITSAGGGYFSSNIGIGTTTPTTRLSISGGNVFINDAAITSGTPKAAITKEYLDSSLSAFASTNNTWVLNGLNLYASSTAWNVGIGVTNPGSKLDVAGLIRQGGYGVSDAATDNLLVNGDFEMGDSYGWNSGTVVAGGLSGNNSLQLTGYVNLSSNDLIPVDPTRDILHLEAWVKKSVAGTTPGVLYFGYYAYDANKTVITSAPCGSFCYFAASGWTIPVDGAWHKVSATTVGEGTSYPNFPVGTKYVRVLGLVNYSGSADTVTLLDHVTLKRLTKGPLVAGNNFSSSNLVDQHQYSTLYTTAANNLILSSPGNVGIGTTNPGTRLSVIGSGNYSIDAGNYRVGNVATPVALLDAANKSYVDSTIASATSSITLWGGTTGGNVWNLNSGNVGIGTTAPRTKLDLTNSGNLTAGSGIFNGAVGTGYTTGVAGVSVYSMGTVGRLLSYDGATYYDLAMGDWGGGNPNIMLKAGGNVGINRGTPTYKLDVAGTLRTDNGANFATISGNVGIGTTNPAGKLDISIGADAASGLLLNSTTNANRSSRIFFKDSSTASAIYQGEGLLRFTAGAIPGTSSGGTVMAINTSGNIGMGTTTPGTRLTVVGSGNYSIDAGNYRVGNVAAPVSTLDAVNKSYMDSAIAAATSTISNLWGGTTGGNVWSLNSGNVGIGVTNPGAKLTLPNNQWLGAVDSSGSGVANMFRINSANQIEVGSPLLIGQMELAQDGGLLTFVNMPVSSAAPNGSAQGYSLRLDGNNLLNLYSTSNGTGGVNNLGVGINTSTPDAALSVNGTFHVIGALNSVVLDRLSGTGNRVIMADASGSLFATSTAAATGLPAGTSGQTMRHDGSSWIANSLLYNNGTNVGIGTSNPRAKLEVGANDGVSASIVAANIIEVAGLSEVAQAANITVTGGTLVSGGPTSKNGKGYWDITSFPATITFNTRGWWTYAGMSFTAANVHNYPAGGGNRLPGSFLVEASADGVTWGTVDDETAYTSALYYENNVYGGSGKFIRITARAPQPGETTSKLANVQIFNGQRSGKNPFSLSAEGNAVFIGGNIGIDTIQPIYKLDVNGAINIANGYSEPTSETGYRLKFVDNGGVNNDSGIGVSGVLGNENLWINKGSANGNIRFMFGTLGEKVTFNSSGNVGISTTTPAARLSISGGNAFINDAAITSGTPKAAITKEYLDSSLSAFASTNNTWVLNGSNLYASSTTWNVGVGTTNPAEKLHVASGNIAFTNANSVNTSQGLIKFSAPAHPNAFAGIEGKTNSGGSDQVDLVFYTGYGASSPEKMRILAQSGNVGIGTSTPLSKLFVSGGNIFINDAAITSGTPKAAITKEYLDSSLLNKLTAQTNTSAIDVNALGNNFLLYGGSTGSWINRGPSGHNGGAILHIPTHSGDYYSDLWFDTSNARMYIRSVNAATIGGWLLMPKVSTSTQNYITKWASVDSIGNSQLFDNGTNVGIGTTTPGTRFTVVGSGNYSIDAGNFRIGNVATPVALLDAANKSYVDSTIASATSSITLWGGTTGGNVWSLNSGNVGIGITNPIGKLFVGSNWRISHGGTDLYVGSGAGVVNTSSLGITYAVSNTSTTAPSAVGITLYNDDTTAGGWSPLLLFSKAESGATPYKATMAGIAAKAPLGTGNGDNWIDGELHFYTAGAATSGLVDRMVINKDGNVGIGMTAPEEKLQITGALALTRGVFSNFISGATIYDPRLYATANSGSSYPFQSMGNLIIQPRVSGAGFDVVFATHNGTSIDSRMVVKDSGNVGIGTTNPLYKLDVIDSTVSAGENFVRISKDYDSSVANRTAGIILGTDSPDNGNTYRIRVDSSLGYMNSPAFRIQQVLPSSAGVVDSFTILSGGNVGIGTTTPTAKLSLSGGNAFINDAAITSGTPKAAITKEYLDSSLSAFASTNNAWILNGSNLYASSTTWNVGVGTTNPLRALHVAKDLTYSQSQSGQLYLGGASDSNKRLMLGYDTTNNYGFIEGVNFGIAYSNVVINPVGGNVGIGLTNPGAKLDVNGSFRTNNSATFSLLNGTGNRVTSVDATGVLGATNIFAQSGNVGIGTSSPLATLHVEGGVVLKRTAVADTNYTVQATDYIIGYSSITANRTITVPNSVCSPGRFFVVVDESGQAAPTRAIIIDPEGSTPIIGAPTFNITGAYNSVYIFCGSNAWYIL